MKFRLTLCATLFVVATLLSYAQFNVVPGGNPKPLGKDTLCFRYDLRSGDTLMYAIEAMDSVKIENGQSFFKLRSERVRVVCDSGNANGIMHLSITLISSSERNISGSDTTTRTTHPWIGRTQRIGIDALGHRAYAISDNSTKACIAPGGSMQPLLFPIIDTSCGRQNQSWLSEDTIVIVENAVPNPVVAQQIFWRVLDKADTLGRAAKRIQYTGTGLGSVVVRTRDIDIAATTIVASYGLLTFDAALNLVLHQFASVENKFTMKLPSGDLVRGRHLLSEYITLDYLRGTAPGREYHVSLSKMPAPSHQRSKRK